LREAIGPTRRIYGVDLSAGMLRKARKLSDHHHWTNIHLTEGDAANYVAPEPLDGVLFSLSYNTMPHHLTVLYYAGFGNSFVRAAAWSGFQASARPWRKTTSAFQSVDDAKSLAAGRPGRHHR
jgi:trans-aconitate methyltransferase